MKVQCKPCDGKGWITTLQPSYVRQRFRKLHKESHQCEACGGSGMIDDGKPDYLDDPTYRQLLMAVCERTEDDLPRLVMADWLDERGDVERAEFVRVQCEKAKAEEAGNIPYDPYEGHTCFEDPCEVCRVGGRYTKLESRERELFEQFKCNWFGGDFWAIHYLDRDDMNGTYPDLAASVVTRGFISSIQIRLGDFSKSSLCSECGGDGRHLYETRSDGTKNYSDSVQCRECEGHGSFCAFARELFQNNPITEVSFIGLEPVQILTTWNWFRGHPENESPYRLPPILYDALRSGRCQMDSMDVPAMEYDSREAAMTDLKNAMPVAVEWGRSLAGLSVMDVGEPVQ